MLADVGQVGLFNSLTYIRKFIGVRIDEQTGIPYGTNNIASGILCVYCNSFWIGLGATILFHSDIAWGIYLALPFAFSAVAIQLESRLD